MRVVLDTNILVSALLVRSGCPFENYSAWRRREFTLVSCESQIGELRAALRKPSLVRRIKPYHAGSLINDIRDLGELVAFLPHVERSPDPNDNFLLALCEAGNADYLVTGDKHGLLSLGSHEGTQIVSSSSFAASLGMA
jgi:putative PIN family toxin of toxin-antitoxin system